MTLGVLVALFPAVEASQVWLARVLRPIPPLAWIPFAIIWFGITETAAACIISIGIFWINYFTAMAAVQAVDKDLIEVARAFGHRTFAALLKKVILPGAAPGILSGLRAGLGQGWMTVVAAELFGIEGIGQRMMEASGLLAILGCHPRIAVPEVTWYYPRFRPYLHTYGDIGNRDNFRTLALEMAHGLRVPYWRMDVDPHAFVDAIAERAVEIEQSFAGVFAAMLERYAAHEGKPRWGEKTPYNIFYLDRILEDFPNTQFVYIYRDGRDASAEFLESAFGPTNSYSAARIWRDGQEAALAFRQQRSVDQWFDIKYEELVREPVDHLRRLCTFLGEEYTDALIAFHTTPTAKRRGATKDNWALAHPINCESCLTGNKLVH